MQISNVVTCRFRDIMINKLKDQPHQALGHFPKNNLNNFDVKDFPMHYYPGN